MQFEKPQHRCAHRLHHRMRDRFRMRLTGDILRCFAVTAFAVTALAACQQSGNEEGAAEMLDAAFTAASCASVPEWRSPTVGTKIVSRIESVNAGLRMQVTSTEAFSVEHSTTYVLPNGLTAERGPRAQHFAFLYDREEPGIRRAFDYTPDPSVVGNLRPGDAREFDVTETILDQGRTATAKHRFSVEMLDCGRLRWAGGETPVKVFRVVMTHAMLNADGEVDGTGRDAFVAYLAPQYGWPLLRANESGSREEVQSIEPPA